MMDDLEEGSLPVHRGTQMEEKAQSLDAVSPSPPHTTTTHQPTHRARSQGKMTTDGTRVTVLTTTTMFFLSHIGMLSSHNVTHTMPIMVSLKTLQNHLLA